MGCFSSKRLSFTPVPTEFMDELKKKTTLHRSQIQYLFNRFCELADKREVYPPRHLHKYNIYSGLLQLNPLLPTILNRMFDDKPVINFVDFALFLSTFQAHSLKTKKDYKNEITNRKLRLLFDMYDHDKDGRINKTDLVMVVHKLFSDFMENDKILHIVETIMLEMDISNTNQILYNDFVKAFENFDMTEKMVTFIPEYTGRLTSSGFSSLMTLNS